MKIVIAFVFVFVLAPASLQGQELRTHDTILRLQADDDGIRIVSLHSTAAGTGEWRPNVPASIVLVDHTRLDGREVPIKWRKQSAQATQIVYTCDDPPLTLTSVWEASDGPGPIEHHIRIVNRGQRELLIPRQGSLSLTTLIRPEMSCWWVEKGGSNPTPVGIHEIPIGPQSLVDLKSGPIGGGEPRQPIPFVAILDKAGGQGWYAGIEFSGRVQLKLAARKGAERLLDCDLGLENEPDLLMRLGPGATYDTPIAFIGCFHRDMDDCGNLLRPWVANHLRPPVHNQRYPLLVNNSWGGGMVIDQKLARSMIDDSARLGLEMFHIDAGWFCTVGDWSADPVKFPDGLAPIADYAHQRGIMFGLWVGWTQGGIAPHSTSRPILSVRDPSQREWFTEDYPPNWKPSDFTGATVCLADPRAEKWCLDLLRGIVKQNKLDMLEHDQRMIVESCVRTDHAHTGSQVDVASRACEAYYRIYDTLRRENPNLLFEDCVNGGQMVDFGVIRRVHYISITDTYDPLSNRRAFFDASYLIPPAMCECYIEQHPGHSDANFLYMLRSGMMGWCTIMLDTRQWTPHQHELAKRQFDIYRTRLRPLINHADLYHVSDRPDGVNWDGIEYVNPKSATGVLFAFRGTTAQAKHTFKLRGLNPTDTYEISFEREVSTRLATGQELATSGFVIELNEPQSSELVYLRRK